MSRALWIATTVWKEYAHILICILISLWCGSGPCRVVLIKALLNLRCFLKLMAQIWELSCPCWLFQCWKCQQTLYNCGLLRGACEKMELTLVSVGCLQNRLRGPNLTSRCPRAGRRGRLLRKPLMVMNGVIRDGRWGRKRTRRAIPSHAFLYILLLEAGYISAWQWSVLTAQNSTFLCAQGVMIWVNLIKP